MNEEMVNYFVNFVWVFGIGYSRDQTTYNMKGKITCYESSFWLPFIRITKHVYYKEWFKTD